MNSLILYYTAGQKTKIFAQALSEVTGFPVQEITSPLNDKSPLKFILHALYLAVTGKAYPITEMPVLSGVKEIFVCAPIWGGNLAAPAWYLLNHAPLHGVTVNLIITCGSPTAVGKYRSKALESLKLVDCVPGKAYGFCTTKDAPGRPLIAEQLREMLPDAILKG